MTFKRRYSPGFNSRKPKQQPEIDPEVHAKAREAVRVFRTMQPGLTGLASALAGRDLPVVLDTAADGERASRTDGHRIFYTPPIQLGERVPHERRLCDRRGGNGRMLCKACAIREKVQADIYHEVAHNAFGTFRKPSSQEVKDAVGMAVRERGTKYLKKIEKQVEELGTRNRLSLMPLAGMISPYLPSMFNALEDARVDEGMYRARIGTRIIMRSDYIEIFENGTQTLTKGKVMWRDAPLQAQLTIGLFCIGSGLPYRDYLCDKAVEVLEDTEIHDAVANISDAKSSAETFATSLKVLARFRELGYFKSDKDPEDEEPQPEAAPEPEPQQDEPQQQDENEDQNDEPDSEDSDDPERTEGDPETDQASPEDEGDDDDGVGPESPDDQGSGDEDGPSGEDGDQDPSEEDGESGTSDSPGGSGFGPSGVGDGSEEDQAGDPGSGAGSEDVGEGTPEDGMGEGPSDDSGEHDSTEGTPDSPAGESVPEDSEASPSPGPGGPEDSSTDLGQTEEEGELTDDDEQGTEGDGERPSEQGDGVTRGVGEDSPGEGESNSSGEPGADSSAGGSDQGGSDGGQGHPDDREGVDESHVQHDDSGSDHEVGGPEDDGAHNPDGYDHDDQSRTDSREERRDGDETEAVQGEGESAPEGERGSPPEGERGAEAGESAAGDFDGEDPGLRDEPVPDLGTEEDVELALSQFTEHLDDLNEEGEEERGPRHGNPDMTGDEIKAIQVAVLQEKFFDSPSVGVTGVAESRYNDFSQIPARHNAWGSAGNSNYHADYDVPEQILGKGLMELRRALSDNYRASFEKHLKSGKINQRTLGRRAWNQDPRLFQKKRLPGKRSYSVIIGIDISGSTAGRNIYLAKRAAFAQAQLCHRLGIEFSIYAHSARSDRFGGQGGFTMDIYEVKSADEVWGSQQQHALRSLQDCYNNLDGHTIEYYRKKIERRPATDKIILYYTDGAMPASNREEETEILLREIATCKKKKITLLGVGIRTDSPLQYGLDTVKVDNDQDLIEVVRHLERALLHVR